MDTDDCAKKNDSALSNQAEGSRTYSRPTRKRAPFTARRDPPQSSHEATIIDGESMVFVEDQDDDPTTVAHACLRSYLGMTVEELQQLSKAYRALPPGRRGPDEISVSAEDAMHLGKADTPSSEVGCRDGSRARIQEIPGAVLVMHAELGVDKARLRRHMLRWPRLLETSSRHVRRRVKWMRESLDMNCDEVANLVLKHPPLLIKSVSGQLQANCDWLEATMQLSRNEVKRIVIVCPQLLVKSVSDNFTPKINFLLAILGIDMPVLRVIFRRYPQLFNLGIENIELKVRLLSERLGLTQQELITAVVKCPSVLAYSAEQNLIPTFDIFVYHLGATKKQMRDAVIRQPRLLGMSLDRRIVPRLRVIRAAGLTPSWSSHHEIMLFSTNQEFKEWLVKERLSLERKRQSREGGLGTGQRDGTMLSPTTGDE